jgi:DNA-binding MurR/RpiR family transcriptional regulator
MNGCLLKVKEALNDLKPSEKKVANYILKFPEESIGLSVGELAERCDTSNAAIIRFCKTLRFEGYREFAIKMASDIASAEEDNNTYTDIQVGDNLDSIIKNVSHNNKKSITDTLLVLDPAEIKKAVDVLHRSKRIDFYGVGASGIIALDAQQKFMRINRYSMAYRDTHLQATAAANLSEDDVAVFVSYSGETRDLVETIKFANNAGATTISITRFGNNTLSEKADIKLFISSPETSMRSGASGSRIAQLNVIDILFTAVGSIEYPEIKKYLDRTRKVRAIKKFNK